MTISAIEYLKQTQDTIEHIFYAINIEEEKINDTAKGLPIKTEGLILRRAREHFYKNYLSMDNNFDDHFDERQIMDQFVKFAKSSSLIVAHEITVGILYGTLLQIAKQAISIAHKAGGRNCGLGREIAGLSASQIVWDARNQALHFEEGQAKPKTKETFNQLASVYGDDFTLEENTGVNLARNVVRNILEWNNAELFYSDLYSIVEK
ncbi:MAG: hypothetical protein KZQ74_01605 [gamma proteobacterium symbiont of Bathyaustriella thionipta]|nr:hypothetical protein [gamma proteobacterium symbiont of Bathyaustriella thionipta]MCU7958368.1 hypothetical protein [gamma proteobacterium symbiont of Bathyaustriella thionipta]MCU7965900.1 hypothetical protein [gamma proteobacterium symbiont of Bathyaustriella thionipta]